MTTLDPHLLRILSIFNTFKNGNSLEEVVIPIDKFNKQKYNIGLDQDKVENFPFYIDFLLKQNIIEEERLSYRLGGKGICILQEHIPQLFPR